ncbi:MAG: rhomboid family intramembrane serine protease [Bacillaceae bacterium]|nr:rhomboid family intramembrane serine protease [Bacillaceae bacterium]
MFVRNEDFRTFLRYYPVVSSIIAIHLVLFLWMYLLGPLGGDYIRFYGVGWNLAIAHGQWWRLITPIFMHVQPGHFLFNSFSLVLFGPALEQMLGKFKFVILYLFTGILANVATFYLADLNFFHLGASGAIYGLFGIYLYMVFFKKELLDHGNAQLITTILVLGLVMTFINDNINVYAHLFGLIAGFALAPIFLYKTRHFHGYYRRRSYGGGDEIAFNPRRWQKKRLSPDTKKKLIWGIFIALVLMGLLIR